MILTNAKPAPAASKPTRKPRVRRPPPQAVARSPVPGPLSKSRVLNPLHLNQVLKERDPKSRDKEEDSGFYKEKNPYVALQRDQGAEKCPVNKTPYEVPYGSRSRDHYPHRPSSTAYQHKRGSEPQYKSITKTIRAPYVESSSSNDEKTKPGKAKTQVRLPPLFRTLT